MSWEDTFSESAYFSKGQSEIGTFLLRIKFMVSIGANPTTSIRDKKQFPSTKWLSIEREKSYSRSKRIRLLLLHEQTMCTPRLGSEVRVGEGHSLILKTSSLKTKESGRRGGGKALCSWFFLCQWSYHLRINQSYISFLFYSRVLMFDPLKFRLIFKTHCILTKLSPRLS